MGHWPAYAELHRTGELRRRADALRERLAACDLCPRRCGANRLKGKPGACRGGREAVVASCGPHWGEEAPLVGRNGSGTVFFAGCNLDCVFCQNHDISQCRGGSEVSAADLAGVFLRVRQMGCHNLNLVTPTHVVSQVVDALCIAVDAGFDLPLVYNTGGYDSVETLRLLDGIVDIYMPDMKFDDPAVARRLCVAADYPAVNRAAVLEMHRQTGDLTLDPDGVAVRGVLVRHLVLPGGLSGTEGIARFLAEQVSRRTYINIMAQYRPCHLACGTPGLDRRITREEFAHAVATARAAGLTRFDR